MDNEFETEEPFIVTTADMLEIVAGGGNGSEYVDVSGLIETAAKELREKDNEIEQLREALRFYAEWGIDAPAVDAIIEEDRGDKARAALNIVLADLENGDY